MILPNNTKPASPYHSKNHNYAQQPPYGNTPSNTETICNTIILGKMYDYGIPIAEYSVLKEQIFKELLAFVLQQTHHATYYDVVYDECDKIMPTHNFKAQLKETLES